MLTEPLPEVGATNKRFYDHGWNAAHRGEEYDAAAYSDWRTGWRDYQTARATIPEELLTEV